MRCARVVGLPLAIASVEEHAGCERRSMVGDPDRGAGPGGHPLACCPACASTRIVVAVDTDSTNFLCESCQRCWHVEFRRVWRVDPHTCMTCVHREDCLRVADGPPRAPLGVMAEDAAVLATAS